MGRGFDLGAGSFEFFVGEGGIPSAATSSGDTAALETGMTLVLR